MKKARRVWVGAFFMAVLLLVVGPLVSAIWGEYGGHNLRIAVAGYVEDHEGEWPRSWRAVEPYHKDVLLGCRSTFFVRRYWRVAWRIDPREVYRESAGRGEHGKGTPVVYRVRDVDQPEEVDDWVLGKRIEAYYERQYQGQEERMPVQ